jgi:hypothetical protein
VACETEIVVVRAVSAGVELECGGRAMVPVGEAAEGGAPEPGRDGGTQPGKRYTSVDETIEVLCTKGGAGTLAVSGTPMEVKAAKPLPSSD